MALAAGTKLGRYEIRAKIGEGGMGEVYLAQDTNLDRKVALKVLPAEVAADHNRMSRFVQEAKAASALNHPNIITIYEIDEWGSSPTVREGAHFIATEFIDGETLRERMRKAPVKLGEVLDVAIQTSSALSAAHEAHIIHRDIKPENIMLRHDGIVKVLDFGLAKLTERLPPDSVDAEAATKALVQTEPGVVMGTAAYMSPEQARGLTVDARTDIFSLGVVIYEMVAGRAPFGGATRSDLIVALLERDPPPLARFTPEAPAEMERLVMKTLAKDREERYQTAKDLLIDLRQLKKRLEFAAELERTASPDRRADAPTKTSIAVLPFANMSDDAENEYFCDGLAEELLNALAKIDELKVAARTSAFSFKGKNTNVSEIGRALNVNSVLEGSVRKSGKRVRITVQLVNASDGYHLWSERYDRELQDIFDVQDEITLAVVDALKVKLLGEEKAAVLKRYTDDTEAYELYLKGRYYWNKRTGEGIKKSIECFQQAIEKDPGYALAYTGVADSYASLGFSFDVGSLPPREVMPKAKAAATRALELDNTLAEAHTSLAMINLHYDWNWPAAEREFQLALGLNPNYANAHHWYSHYLLPMGRTDESLAESRRALELAPFDLIINVHLGWHYLYTAQYDLAVDQFKKTLEMDQNYVQTHWYLGLTYEEKGMHGEAVAELQKALALAKESTDIQAELGHAYAVAGKRVEAMHALDELRGLSERRFVSAYNIATIYAGLGQKDEAFDWLEKAYEERSDLLVYIKVDAKLAGLRSDPRFADLVRRVGLPQ
jgi:serine/threonine protein kinase/Tfp pilus assembly protein PilF